MKKEEPAEKFRIKSYGKSEPALVYFSDRSPQAAIKALKRAISNVPELSEALIKAGLKPGSRQYTPAQVKLIAEALGVPE